MPALQDRAGPLLPGLPQAPGSASAAVSVGWRPATSKEIPMPVILWLLGVPLAIVLLLMLFGVI
ncbi:MAG TPA: hypothetical protein VLK85_14800 [Ramlibacter sp.]|nr:hypothetical protein [Ramlibacter sp.]